MSDRVLSKEEMNVGRGFRWFSSATSGQRVSSGGIHRSLEWTRDCSRRNCECRRVGHFVFLITRDILKVEGFPFICSRTSCTIIPEPDRKLTASWGILKHGRIHCSSNGSNSRSSSSGSNRSSSGNGRNRSRSSSGSPGSVLPSRRHGGGGPLVVVVVVKMIQ
jgi:hypothetical protein